ncbi:MAG: hypothetical protein RL417_330 [Pseudomonadota bacterium]
MPEVAISAVLLVSVVFSCLELWRGAFAYAGLNIGLLQAARAAANDLNATVDGLRGFVQSNSNAPLSDFKICPYAATPCTTNSLGSSGQLMQLGATATVRLFGLYSLEIATTTVFRREPDFRAFSD